MNPILMLFLQAILTVVCCCMVMRAVTIDWSQTHARYLEGFEASHFFRLAISSDCPFLLWGIGEFTFDAEIWQTHYDTHSDIQRSDIGAPSSYV